jgi:hypothetical protein
LHPALQRLQLHVGVLVNRRNARVAHISCRQFDTSNLQH